VIESNVFSTDTPVETKVSEKDKVSEVKKQASKLTKQSVSMVVQLKKFTVRTKKEKDKDKDEDEEPKEPKTKGETKTKGVKEVEYTIDLNDNPTKDQRMKSSDSDAFCSVASLRAHCSLFNNK